MVDSSCGISSGAEVDFAPAPLSDKSELSLALREFFSEGFEPIEKMARAFAMTQPPEELHTPIIRIMFRYLNVMRQALDQGMTIEGSHACACNAVMGDPKVAGLIEGLMQQGVHGIVTAAVENR